MKRKIGLEKNFINLDPIRRLYSYGVYFYMGRRKMNKLHLLRVVAVIAIAIAIFFPVLSEVNATESFVDSGITLAGIGGTLVWGDYDNDGDLDLAMCDRYATKIYRNDGNNTFTDINAGLEALSNRSSLAWGDYDNDGDLDLALTGFDEPNNETITKIYRNNGNDTFTDIEAVLLGVMYGSLAWGDYDNDGDLDLVICGADATNMEAITKIYRNNGNDTFTDIGAGLEGLGEGTSLAWGDFDNDGDLDLAVCGLGDSGLITKIYRNDGTETFTDSGITLIGANWGSLAWSDFDNDGDLDLALCGMNTEYEPITKIYRNNGDGTFTAIEAGLTEVLGSSLAWGDYDNDGNLDLAVSGSDVNWEPITKIYRNNGNNTFTDIEVELTEATVYSLAWGDYDNDGYLDLAICGYTGSENITKIYKNVGTYNPNTPPSAPTFLYKEDIGDTAILLGWLDSSDVETFDSGLYYNLRVGTYPQGNDIVSGVYGSPLLGNYLRPKLSDWWQLGVRLNNLPGGIYYWSVQAIDTGLQASAWSEEEFVIQGEKLHFSASAYTVTEIEPSVTITVTHAEPTTGVVTVHYSTSNGTATAGEDYVATSGVLTFNEGETLQTFVVPIINNDDLSEGNETINLTLSEPSPEGTILGDPSTATITIYKKISFVDSFKVLPQIAGGSVAWGDYDNDGDLDLALCGAVRGDVPSVTKIYRNDGGVLTDIEAGLPGFRNDSSLAWGDYDNDGDLDLAICGATYSPYGNPTNIYKNNGDDTFTDIEAGLTEVSMGASLAWGDFDNDGYLDLAVCGVVTTIYRNNGDDTFTDIEAGLPGVSMGASLAWGDFDNDSDLDLAICGGNITRIYKNNGNGTFTDIEAGLTGVTDGSLAWGDYDNDGDLDLVISGRTSSGNITKTYRNNSDNTFTDIEAG
jgi:hypothetical protein